MKTSFADRMQLILDYLNIGATEFENNAGLGNGLVGKAMKRNKGFTPSTIEKINSTFPKINTDWLNTGNGGMLKVPNEPIENYKEIIDKMAEELKKVKDSRKEVIVENFDLKERIKALEEEVSRLTKKPRS